MGGLGGGPMWAKLPAFRADHPFVFLIRDNRTGGIIFLGRFVCPATMQMPNGFPHPLWPGRNGELFVPLREAYWPAHYLTQRREDAKKELTETGLVLAI